MEMWLLSVDWLVKLTRKPTHRAMLEDMDIHPQWDREERRAFAKVARSLPLPLRRDLYALLWRAGAHGAADVHDERPPFEMRGT